MSTLCVKNYELSLQLIISKIIQFFLYKLLTGLESTYQIWQVLVIVRVFLIENKNSKNKHLKSWPEKFPL